MYDMNYDIMVKCMISYIHLESCSTPGTLARQYKMVCSGTSQYVSYSIQGRTRNLKMVHTSTYQLRKFLWQYILVCTGMYSSCLVPAQYKVVQGGTRWYKMVQCGTNNIMEVHGGARPYENCLNRTGWYVLACTDPYDSIWVCCPAAGFAAAILPGR
jgi:hypothetical protein